MTAMFAPIVFVQIGKRRRSTTYYMPKTEVHLLHCPGISNGLAWDI
eukprot:CAMPEP_0202018114 /NCGR_PEP_ID=MMETSP0905-20130828/38722_1 /ASSEMBLY_ACC=CAM_ASM_000554 /TAXON_ID=420261 /ORGANISM="Thalassiosira antarctica, Strain CCMP982" /LENGTH=45 /DNA_ID= /DNA_START= /DNA_END= /DNA_ORIENTATION=